MVSSSPLARLLLVALATPTTASLASDFARDGLGFRSLKGGAGRRAQGAAASEKETTLASAHARKGVGFRRPKGGAGRRATAEKAEKATKPERFKTGTAGRGRNKNKSDAPTGAPARVAGLEHGGTPFPTDDATYPPTPRPSAVLAPLAEEAAAAVVSVPDAIAIVASPTNTPTFYPTLLPSKLPTAPPNPEEEEEETLAVAAAPAPETTSVPATAAADPAASYEALAWADLPAEIKDDMAALGYTADLWDEGGVAAADTLDWDELDAAEREAASDLGYDEASWAADEEETAAVAQVVTENTGTIRAADISAATKAVTNAAATAATADAEDDVTSTPTFEPTGAAPPCPAGFDPTTEYAAADVVAVEGHVFQCNPADTGSYVRYCNILHWDVGLLDYDARAEDLWHGAWVHLGACAEEAADYEGAARR